MNKVVIIGRLTKDPDLKFAAGNGMAISHFSIAVDRRGKEKKTDFINCVAFNKTAELISEYTIKGSMVGISGSIQTGSYEKDGIKHYTTEIVASEVQFLDTKRKEEAPRNEMVEVADVDIPFM